MIRPTLPGPCTRAHSAASLAVVDGTSSKAGRPEVSFPERQREAVVLRHIEGLANPEIAEILQIGVEAVESLTARGKRALAAALSGQRAALGYEEAE